MPVQYSEDFKKNAVKKLLLPNAGSLRFIGEQLGVPESTLYGWKQVYANIASTMKKQNLISKMTREEKFNLLLKLSAMPENELGVYLRENGLYSNDIDSLREEIINGPRESKKASVDPEVVKLRSKLNETEKNLKRKDKALAEMSARVILLKKSHEIWGDQEDDE